MEINIDTRVGDIVKANYTAAKVFDKNNIDFCCGGAISLKDACNQSETDIELLIPELERLITTNDPDSKYIDSLELNELCDYIQKRHHTYVNENIPFLQEKLQKLCDVHGDNHQELFELKELFDGAAKNLSEHMKTEEDVLFPYIRKMVTYKKKNAKSHNEFGKLQTTIDSLDEEHHTEGRRFEKIAKLSSNYTCPPDGCSTFQVSYQTLFDFEKDLHRHIHLENNILFPKALKLEQQLMAKVN